MFKNEKDLSGQIIDLKQKTLYNFYGQEFLAKKKYLVSVNYIKNQAAKKIALLRMELKKERKIEKNKFKILKRNYQKQFTHNQKSEKLKCTNENYNEKERYFSFKTNSIQKQAKLELKRLIKNSKSNRRYYNNLKRGFKYSDDTLEQKKILLQTTYSNIEKSQIENAHQIVTIKNFLKGQIPHNEFVKTSIGKYLNNEYLNLAAQNISLQSVELSKHKNKKIAQEKIETLREYKKNILNKEVQNLDAKKQNYIEQITLIRKTKNSLIEKLKKEKNKNKIGVKIRILQVDFWNKFQVELLNFFLLFILQLQMFVQKICQIRIDDLALKIVNQKKKYYQALLKLTPTNTYDHILTSKVSELWQKVANSLKINLVKQREDYRVSKLEYLKIKEDKVRYAQLLNQTKKESKNIKTSYFRKLKKLIASFLKRKVTYKFLKNELSKDWKTTRDKLNKNKLQNDLIKVKFSVKDSWKKLKVLSLNVFKETNDKIEYFNKYYPIEVKDRFRFFLGITNFLFGGLGYLFAKQIKKGFVFCLITTFLYAFIIPFAIGFFELGGDGLAGLHKLGAENFKPDSRYYFIEGVYSLGLITTLILYNIMMGFSGYRIGLIMEKGVRPNNWFISKKVLDRIYLPYVLSIPAFFMVIFTVLIPLFAMFLLAFTNWGASANPLYGEPFKWIGFKNFTLLFESEGIGPRLASEFGGILSWTLIWGLSTWLLGTILSIAVTLLINSNRIRFTAFWRTVMILPMAIPAFIMILMFKILLRAPSAIEENDYGPLYRLLVDMNLWIEVKENNIGVQYVNDIMKSAWSVRFILMLLSLWFGIGAGMLYFTGIIKGISPSLYEAAKVDGAKAWQQHRTITLPHLFYIIAPTLIPAFIAALNNYSLIWLFNDGGPEFPDGSITGAGQSDIVLSWVYKLVKDPTTFDNAVGLTAVICVFFGIISVTIAAPGVFKSKMFKEGRW